MPLGMVIGIAVFGAVFSWPYFEPLVSRPSPAGLERAQIIDAIVDNGEPFDVPVPANWKGSVIGVFEGGSAYAIERTNGQRFYAFFEEEPTVTLEGSVSIRGLWLGYTCAYRNTVFKGECVPEVQIRSFEMLEETEIDTNEKDR